MVSPLMVPSSAGKPREKVNLGPRSPGIKATWPFRQILFVLFFARLALIEAPLRALAYTLFPYWTRQHGKWSVGRCLLVATIRQSMAFSGRMGIFSASIDKSVLPRIDPKNEAAAVWIQPINPQTGLKGEMADAFAAGGCTTTRIPAYWYGENYDGSKGSRDANPQGEKVILYFHGGAYKSCNALPDSKGPIITLYTMLEAASASKKPAGKQAPRRALAVEYRLTDEATFPAIFADALASWQYLVRDLHFSPGDIILSGDSAGGNLALALARYIRDERPLVEECKLSAKGPIADGLVLFSPWCDLSMSFLESGVSGSGQSNDATDIIDKVSLGMSTALAVKGLPLPFLTSRWTSPVCTQRSIESDLFDGFPRAFIAVGGREVFVDEIRALTRYYREAAEKDNARAGPVTLYEEPLAPHDYLVIPFTFSEERKRTRSALASWY